MVFKGPQVILTCSQGWEPVDKEVLKRWSLGQQQQYHLGIGRNADVQALSLTHGIRHPGNGAQ